MSYYAAKQPDAIQQGDIYFAPVVRIESSTASRHLWSQVDQGSVEFTPDGHEDSQAIIQAGFSPVMVLSHDCQMDRQMNSEFHRLRRADPTLSVDDALQIVESNPDLDRFVTVAPIFSLDKFRADAEQVKAGAVMGLFYVPSIPSGWITVDSAVDLNYVSTIDRSLLELRGPSLSDHSAGRLRLALARLFALRSPEIGFEVEQAVGQKIVGVRHDKDSPAEIVLEMKDGSELSLLLRPKPIKQGRPNARAPM